MKEEEEGRRRSEYKGLWIMRRRRGEDREMV
jgi:hypothetical protein